MACSSFFGHRQASHERPRVWKPGGGGLIKGGRRIGGHVTVSSLIGFIKGWVGKVGGWVGAQVGGSVTILKYFHTSFKKRGRKNVSTCTAAL